MVVAVGKILGKAAGGRWGVVHEFLPGDEGRLEEKGKLAVVVGLNGEGEKEQVEMVETGREILARINELYYGGEGQERLGLLKAAVEKVREEFGDVEVGGVVAAQGAMFVVTGGEMGVWVKREQSEGFVIDPMAGGIKAMSGWAVPGQVVVVGNGKFWQEMPVGILKVAAENCRQDMNAAVEMLMTMQHGSDKGGGEVGMIINVVQVEPRQEDAAEAIKPEISETAVAGGASLVRKEEVKSKWRDGAKRLVDKIGEKWGRSSGTVYVTHGDKSGGRKKMIYAGLAFLGLMMIFVVGGRWKNQKEAKEASEVTQLWEVVEANFEEAKALVGLNPARSKTLLEQVESNLAIIEQKQAGDTRVAEMRGEMGEVLGAVSGVKNLTVKEVINLDLLRTGMRAERMVRVDGVLVVLDMGESRLAVVNPETGAGKIVAGKDTIARAGMIAGYPGKVMVVADKGVVECETAKWGCRTVVEREAEWKKVKAAGMYAGNIYLLDGGAGEIWRYPVTEEGFGARQAWLASEEERGVITAAEGMTIDGSIWVVGTGQTARFTRGVRDGGEISGLGKGISSGAGVYTDDEAEKVYILDAKEGRVVILNKNGEYEGQLMAEELKEAKDFVVDERGDTIYVLGGSRVWQAEM